MCTFWLVEALTRAGAPTGRSTARLIFEKMLGYANHLGLYAEETGAARRGAGQLPAGVHPPGADQRRASTSTARSARDRSPDNLVPVRQSNRAHRRLTLPRRAWYRPFWLPPGEHTGRCAAAPGRSPRRGRVPCASTPGDSRARRGFRPTVCSGRARSARRPLAGTDSAPPAAPGQRTPSLGSHWSHACVAFYALATKTRWVFSPRRMTTWQPTKATCSRSPTGWGAPKRAM